MKAPQPPLRQSMAGLHTWAGLLAGWLLFAIFVTGGISYFRDELTQWLRPEIPARPAALARTQAADAALATLAARAGDAERWQIDLPGPRSNAIDAAWESAREAGAERTRLLLDPQSGAVLTPRATQGGEFFYYFHFSLHYLPATLGRWLVGLCAIVSLAVLVSGVIVHRRIFSDFFTLRRGKGTRSWLDAHNGFSVLSLPFHLMIVYTGLVTLMFFYLPWAALAVYGQAHARPALAQATQARVDAPPRSGVNAPLADIQALLAEAESRWGRDTAARIIVTAPGDRAARIAIVRGDGDRVSVAPSWLLFDGADGTLLETHEQVGPGVRAWGTTYALHLGRFADPLLRWMFFASSLMGAAMVATGMVLWVRKRRARTDRPNFGLLLVERANVACFAGLPLAVAVFLLANRLLPHDLDARAQWEIDCFFIAWGAAALLAACRDATRAWPLLARAAALAWLALPLVNAIGSSRGMAASWRADDALFLAFDAAFVAMAALCWRLGRRRASA